MTAHNPALPDERRALAVEALCAGTALHLDVPACLVRQAEADARQLVAQHGEEAALRLLTPRSNEAGWVP